MRTTFALIAVLAASAPVSEAMAAAGYTAPWIFRNPTSSQLRAARPAGLIGYGAASFACIAAKGGGLEDCRLLQELPEGRGVEAAARSLLPLFRAGPATRNGALVEDNVLVTVSFPGPRMTPVDKLVTATVAERNAVAPPSTDDEEAPPIVQFSCAAAITGSFEACSVLGPKGQDPALAAATLSLLPKYRFLPAKSDGKPVAVVMTGEVDWRQRFDVAPRIQPPTYRQLLAAYPKVPWSNGVQGVVTVDCKGGVEGALKDCTVLEEGPTGGGFGAAGLSLASLIKVTPALLEGKPIESTIRIPIRFAIEEPGWFGSGTTIFGVVRGFRWAAAPTLSDMLAAYPPTRGASRVAGWARIQCLVAEDRRLQDCAVEDERPAGIGLGAAAISLATKFQMHAQTNATVVSFPITFDPAYFDATPQLSRLQLVAIPTDEDFLATFGASSLPALFRGQGWRLNCAVGATGAFEDCRNGALLGLDFTGKVSAASTLAKQFVADLWTEDGRPVVGQRVVFDMNYDRPKPK